MASSIAGRVVTAEGRVTAVKLGSTGAGSSAKAAASGGREIEAEQLRLEAQLQRLPEATRSSAESMRASLQDQMKALEHEIGFLDVDKDGSELAFEHLAHVKHPEARMRLNDGRADRAGRFLVGSLKLAPAAPMRSLST